MNISLSPEYWGASLWKTMFTIAYTYPNKPTSLQRLSANNFFNSLSQLIPCIDCRREYGQMLKVLPVNKSLVSRIALLQWLEKISTKINARLGKPSIDFQALYKTMDGERLVRMPVSAAPNRIVQPAIATRLMRQVSKRPPRPRTRGQPRRAVKKRPCNCGKKKVQAVK